MNSRNSAIWTSLLPQRHTEPGGLPHRHADGYLLWTELPRPLPSMDLVLARNTFLSAAIVLLLGGCGGIETDDEAESNGTMDNSGLAETVDAPIVHVFDRGFFFLATAADSVVQVPWLFRARSTPEGVHREGSASLGRGGTWEALVHETMDSPPTRNPWRILPGEHLRIVVGEDDQVESLILRDPPRDLETHLEQYLTEWNLPGGETLRLFRGHTLFPAGSVEGFVVEIGRVWEAPHGAPGDWIFLQSGERVQLFMEEVPPIASPRTGGPYRGWARIDQQDRQWLGIQVEWGELRPFERARRDIPGSWRFSSVGGGIVGELVSVNSYLNAEDGEGPILPVTGFFEVTGTLVVDGDEFPVAGTVRHAQY